MRRENERYIKIMDLQLTPMPRNAEPFCMRETIWRMASIAESLSSTYSLDDGKKDLWLSACEIVRYKDVEFAVLLVKCADERLTNPTFANKVERTTRSVPKNDGEAPAVSAHIVISLDPRQEAINPFYSCLAETAPGLSRSVLSGFFTFMCKCGYHGEKVELKDEKGRVKTYVTRPIVRIDEFLSDDLIGRYAGRSVDLIEIFETVVDEKFDSNTVLRDKGVRYFLTPASKGAALKSVVDAALDRFNSLPNARNLKVKILPSVKGAKSEYLKFEKDDEGVSSIMVKQRKIEMKSKHEQCDVSISYEIKMEMLNLAILESGCSVVGEVNG